MVMVMMIMVMMVMIGMMMMMMMIVVMMVMMIILIMMMMTSLQELESLKAEVQSANEFQTQRESLLLKLQVSPTTDVGFFFLQVFVLHS